MKIHGLSKKECLLRPDQYKNVYKSRSLQKSTIVWLYSTPNGLEYNRLGISVSKKTCTNNVIRNRVKRIIRQVYQQDKTVFGAGVDIVFVLKKLPQTVDLNTFDQEIKKQVG
ncbi:MAG: ribonuclease P protein component [Candidatus Omnitrophota bacterium]